MVKLKKIYEQFTKSIRNLKMALKIFYFINF